MRIGEITKEDSFMDLRDKIKSLGDILGPKMKNFADKIKPKGLPDLTSGLRCKIKPKPRKDNMLITDVNEVETKNKKANKEQTKIQELKLEELGKRMPDDYFGATNNPDIKTTPTVGGYRQTTNKKTGDYTDHYDTGDGLSTRNTYNRSGNKLQQHRKVKLGDKSPVQSVFYPKHMKEEDLDTEYYDVTEDKSFRHYLKEATFDLSSDVDNLYAILFKDIVDAIHADQYDFNQLKEKTIYTSVLQSPIAKEAHELNPMRITFHTGANLYISDENSIEISMSGNAIDLISTYGTLSNTLKQLSHGDRQRLINDISAPRVKGSIYHELSHWVDDTMHNKHITNRQNYVRDMPISYNKQQSHMDQYQGHRFLSNYEINAQIHSMVAMKNHLPPKIWDQLTFDNMVNRNPSMMHIRTILQDLAVDDASLYKQWKQTILKRMHREDILGNNMR